MDDRDIPAVMERTKPVTPPQPNHAKRRATKLQYQHYAYVRAKRFGAPDLCPTCKLPYISSPRRPGRCMCKVK